MSRKEKTGLRQKILNWLRNRHYESFFPDDENSLEVYTRNRQQGGA